MGMSQPVFRSAMSLKHVLAGFFALSMAFGANAGQPSQVRPWLDPHLPADMRAALVLAQMTDEEKLSLLRSASKNLAGPIPPTGFVGGIERLGIGPIRETNAELGVAVPIDDRQPGLDDEATALPSGLALAASWDPQIAYASGAMIGEEARRKGFNVLLAGAANLTRDPRNGRNFEYAGEDPLLTGTMVGAELRGVAASHVISTMKHFALNDQESNRTLVDARIDRAAMRESDLLAFEIANEQGHPGSVMCAYNLIAGVHACENDWLLGQVLRREWGFRGWVMSDWGAVHSTVRAVRAGLDQESGIEWDQQVFFGKPLKVALDEGALPNRQLDAMALHILRTMFASGVIDDPPVAKPLDVAGDAKVAEKAASEGIVLLQNNANLLPLSPDLARVAVIGAHADKGVLSGGGSSQVIPIGGPAWQEYNARHRASMIFDPSPPLAAIAAKLPTGRVDFAGGDDIAAAAALAKQADVAIVFATKWSSEGHDSETISLSEEQDRLITAVAAANPRTIVVLETGNPVLMPWRSAVGSIIEAWYPGARGGEAIADVLFGDADPSGRLPVTFPTDAAQLPRSEVPGRTAPWNTVFPVDYREGAAVGYKWFDANHLAPLFPFGFGLSYTRFTYNNLHVAAGAHVTAAFTITNTGDRTGVDVPQLYAKVAGADGQALQRLVAWSRVELRAGESRTVAVTVDPRLLAHFDEKSAGWRIDGGDCPLTLAASATEPRLTATAHLTSRTLPP
jgi:beta-glucosidase